MKVIMLFSPGVDSYISDHMLKTNAVLKTGSNIKRIYYNLNTKCSKYEIEKINQIYKNDYVEIINDLSYLGQFEQTDYSIMNRNLLMICDAATRYSPDTIILSGNKDDRIGDNTDEFRSLVTTIMGKMFNRDLSILSPLKDFEKCRAVYKYVNDIGNVGITNLLNNTISCYSPVEKRTITYKQKNIDTYEYEFGGIFETTECLKCKACYRKFSAMVLANVYVNFEDEKITKEYNKLTEQNQSDIDDMSIERIISIRNYRVFLDNYYV
jgi:7-cyano-7-deazaguanine synthase in queuosine biosynthesis